MISTNISELWKERFSVPFDPFSYLASARPERGLVVSNRDHGIFQLFAWDVPAGALRQLTRLPKGTISGQISADGEHVFYLDDPTGHERGHLVCLPFEGGAPLDLTPDIEPYVLRGVGSSRTTNRLAFNPINQEGFQLTVIDISPDGEFSEPRRIYASKTPAWEARLSHSGELAATVSTERADKTRRYSTLVFDAVSGRKVGECRDEAGSIEAVCFSPLPGDMRLLLTRSASGFRRPLIWDPLSGEKTDIDLQGLQGEVLPLDWSPDGKRILLDHFSQARQCLYLYDLGEHQLKKLNAPRGAYGVMGGVLGGAAYFAGPSEIYTHWQDGARPMSIISLDADTGEKNRGLVTRQEAIPGHPWCSHSSFSSDGREIRRWLLEPGSRT